MYWPFIRFSEIYTSMENLRTITKHLTAALIFSFCAVSMFAMGKLITETQEATVQKTENVYVFMDCQPQKEYDVVFTYSVKMVLDNSQINSVQKIKSYVLKKLKKEAAKKNTTFEAVIINDLDDIKAVNFTK